ncbi:hypothetical protein [Streptomyces sp. NRRL S-350]|uniref:hypothetical protein n=1 Tax=Streptomyces sp. NRRL S-350 TaxID=1463902 RepID=UPI0004C19495|nr:hypothetical protein [Streptomyces sp. NRRL S-350]
MSAADKPDDERTELLEELNAKPYWTYDDIAVYWNMSPKSVRTYRFTRAGFLPDPDETINRAPVWKPDTIRDHPRPGTQQQELDAARAKQLEELNGKDVWTMQDVAVYWGISVESVRTYRMRPGVLPEATMRGRTPTWPAEVIRNHRRPGRGAGGGPKRKDGSQ